MKSIAFVVGVLAACSAAATAGTPPNGEHKGPEGAVWQHHNGHDFGPSRAFGWWDRQGSHGKPGHKAGKHHKVVKPHKGVKQHKGEKHPGRHGKHGKHGKDDDAEDDDDGDGKADAMEHAHKKNKHGHKKLHHKGKHQGLKGKKHPEDREGKGKLHVDRHDQGI